MSLKIGHKVFCITRNDWGRIDAIKNERYFVSFENGQGFWFRSHELTY